MIFQELLSPQHYETLVKLKHNDIIVAAWYQAVTNPLNQMSQDADALMWLVYLLSESKQSIANALRERIEKGSSTYILDKGLVPKEVSDQPGTC